MRGTGRRAICNIAAVALLAGCAAGPDYVPPAPIPPPAQTMDAARAVLSDAGPGDAAWWHVFADPTLDALEERVLAGNLDLAEATARIGRARAALRIAGAAGLPKASAGASYQRERASDKGIMALIGASTPAASSSGGTDAFGTSSVSGSDGSSAYDLFQGGFDASWELDLWGRARRMREASRADAQAAALQRDAARISLSAEVARVYADLRGAEARLELLRGNRTAVSAGMAIAQARLKRGASTRYDEATAATRLAAIDAQIPSARQEASEARNALAMLAGAEPHALDTMLAEGGAALPDVALAVPASLPSDLARSRPDILASEAELRAATARIGVAKADFYPSITLSGSAGLQSLTLGNLGVWNARQFVAGPVLHLPIFQGGQLKGQLELARADQQAAAIRYRATVLRAWHEIDDALESVRTADARLAAARSGVEQSRIAAHVSERRYRAGASGYLPVLVAERERLEREADEVGARTARAATLAALYKALGGGWTMPVPVQETGA